MSYNFFHQVQDDLRHLKEQLLSSQGIGSTQIIDIQSLESAIERTEQSVRVIVLK